MNLFQQTLSPYVFLYNLLPLSWPLNCPSPHELSSLPPKKPFFLTGSPPKASLSSLLPATKLFLSWSPWLCSFSQCTYPSLTSVAGVTCLSEDWDSQDRNLACPRFLTALRGALEKTQKASSFKISLYFPPCESGCFGAGALFFFSSICNMSPFLPLSPFSCSLF